MASLVRDVYGPATTGGPVTRIFPRRVSAPRERTLTELGLRDGRFDRDRHHLIPDEDCTQEACIHHGERSCE